MIQGILSWRRRAPRLLFRDGKTDVKSKVAVRICYALIYISVNIIEKTIMARKI